MAEARIRIGLIYTYDQGWIGGTYYIANLVAAMNILEDRFKPHITILSFDEKGLDIIQAINYPYITFSNLNYIPPSFARIVNKISRMVVGKNILQAEFRKNNFNVLFPALDIPSLRRIKHKIRWVPDFQYAFFPDFFTKEELNSRTEMADACANKNLPLVVSSKDSRSHFSGIYPHSKAAVYVLNFAVSHPDYNALDITGVMSKYRISAPYYFAPNQFWVHKNQKVVIEAMIMLKQQGEKSIQVVFTGKENDPRHPDYAPGLKRLVTEMGLDDRIHFLGFIDRAEQLLLMKHAVAVIQPSLFEGWSTVIEDAKAMGKFVIASGLAVNREQLEEGGDFFEPSDALQLADLLGKYWNNPPQDTDSSAYGTNKQRFAMEFIQMIHTELKND
jgi:glycosyltransferase involved in cell wall biosynthesis